MVREATVAIRTPLRSETCSSIFWNGYSGMFYVSILITTIACATEGHRWSTGRSMSFVRQAFGSSVSFRTSDAIFWIFPIFSALVIFCYPLQYLAQPPQQPYYFSDAYLFNCEISFRAPAIGCSLSAFRRLISWIFRRLDLSDLATARLRAAESSSQLIYTMQTHRL